MNTVTVIIFCVAVILAVVIRVVIGFKQEAKRQNSNQDSNERVISESQPLTFEIAGLYYRPSGTHRLARELTYGMLLALESEPNNEFDDYAVKIIYKNIHIGYVPSVYSKSIFSALQEGVKWVTEVMSNDRSEIPHVWVRLYPTSYENAQEDHVNTDDSKQHRDILDGVDLDMYIKYIAGMLLYSEHGYNKFDNTLPVNLNDRDFLFDEAARLVVIHQQGSTSLIQRKFAIGYNRAGKIMNQLEAAGIVGVALGSRPRMVYIENEFKLASILSHINNNHSLDEILNAVEEKYYDQIQNRKEYMLKCIEQEKEMERLMKIDAEKEEIRNKLLEKERKRQLEKEVRLELKQKGLISDE